jgi:hypothetical protein
MVFEHRKDVELVDLVSRIAPPDMLAKAHECDVPIFNREARMATRLSHDAIAILHEIGDDEGPAWFSSLLDSGRSRVYHWTNPA